MLAVDALAPAPSVGTETPSVVSTLETHTTLETPSAPTTALPSAPSTKTIDATTTAATTTPSTKINATTDTPTTNAGTIRTTPVATPTTSAGATKEPTTSEQISAPGLASDPSQQLSIHTLQKGGPCPPFCLHYPHRTLLLTPTFTFTFGKEKLTLPSQRLSNTQAETAQATCRRRPL